MIRSACAHRARCRCVAALLLSAVRRVDARRLAGRRRSADRPRPVRGRLQQRRAGLQRACRRARPRRTTGKAIPTAAAQRYVTRPARRSGGRARRQRHGARRPRAVRPLCAADASMSSTLVCYPTTRRQSAPRLSVADRQRRCRTCSAAARRRSSPTPTRAVRCCCSRTGLSGSPISGDYIEALKHARELRLRRRRAVPWRSALRRRRARRSLTTCSTRCCTSTTSSRCRRCGRCRCRASLDRRARASRSIAITSTPPNVGGFGASLGGESLLLMAGAAADDDGRPCRRSRCSPTRGSRRPSATSRTSASPFYPAFGRDQRGLDGVDAAVISPSAAPPTRRRRIGATREGMRPAGRIRASWSR